MASPLTAFLEAVYTALDSDSSLGTQINGVYSRVPQDTPPPYIKLEITKVADAATLTNRAFELQLLVHIATNDHNVSETQAIEDSIYTLLHSADLSLNHDHTLQHLLFEDSKTELHHDGMITQTSMRFFAYILIN